MAILKLYGWHGEAEVLGAAREVSYDENSLHIHGLSLVEANRLLGVLGTSQVKAVDITDAVQMQRAMREILVEAEKEKPKEEKEAPKPEPKKDHEVEAKQEEKEEKKEEEAPSPKKRGRGRPKKTAARAAKKEEPEPEPEEEKEEPEQQSLEDELDKSEEDVEFKGNGKNTQVGDWVAGHDNPDGGPGHKAFDTSEITDDVVEKMAAQKSLMGVLNVLVDELEIKKSSEAVEICMDLKDDVPVLKKTSNLATKIERRFESAAFDE